LSSTPASLAQRAATIDICARPAPRCTMRSGGRSNLGICSRASMIFPKALSIAFL